MSFYSCPTVRTLPWVYSKNCSRRPWNLRQAGIHGNRAYRSSVRACAGDDDDIFDVLVVGGGAAGLTAAYFASENVEAAEPPRVAVLERTRESGKKILMSGGSRCNVLPAHVSMETDYFTESSRSALRAVFSSWDLKGCFGWLKDGVGLDLSIEEETQKYFPTSNSSREVRDKLVDACTRNGVTFRYNSFLTKMTDCGVSGWRCDLADGDVKFGKRIIFATGGKSFPLVGTDGSGHNIIESLGHKMNETYPALTPLTGQHPGGEPLPGVSLYDVSVETRVSKGKGGVRRSDRSGFLFTHKGYSGPSILDLSHYAVMGMERNGVKPKLTVNWIGKDVAFWEGVLKSTTKGLVPNLLHRQGIPQRMCDALCRAANVPLDRRLSEIRKLEMKSLLEVLTRYELPYEGHQSYKKAEVTGGGVPLSELDCSTMESRVLPGVYLCGEIVDVFGRIGGFNFYWAWLSGRLAGSSCRKSLL